AESEEAVYDEDAVDEEAYYEAESEEAVYDEDAVDEEAYYEAESEETVYDEDAVDEEVYYETEADGAFYGEEVVEEEEYYETESDADGYDEETYYYEEDSAEVYDDEEPVDEYYEAEDSESLYDDFYEEDEDEEEEEEQERILPWSAMSDKNFFQKLWYSLVHMSTMDTVVTTTGILVLVLALVTGAVYVSARAVDQEVASFDTVGSQLDNITVIGEHGLTAVADAEMARISAANAIAEEEENNNEYEENEYTKEVTVSLNMTSIEKDLKIKFVNSKTNRLVPNVPFSVTVTTPGGKTEIWSDDDMDGIIYKAGITPGDYSVSINALTDEKYADYKLPDSAQKVTVKKEIAYEKVEVADEIKKESEIDVKKEDTKENETTVESVLQDTVGWVESTQTVVDSVYTAVPKSQIPDPLATAKSMVFMRTSEVSGNNPTPTPDTDPTPTPTPDPTTSPEAPAVTGVKLDKTEMALKEGETGKLSATVEPAEVKDADITFSSSNTDIATVSSDGTVTAVKAGEATITVTVTSPATSESKTATCKVTVAASQKPVITLDQSELTLEKDKEATLKATVTGAEADKQAVTFSSSDTTVVTVDENGKLKALKAGTVTITVTLKADDSVKAECKVTVTEDTRTLTLSTAALSMAVGVEQEVKATIGNSVTGAVISGTITAKSDNEAVAIVTVGKTENGVATIKITPKATGTAKITVGILEADGKTQAAVTQVLTVTVGNGTIT
ncbi:MAG: Ig-like domain-containing protein, partial [Lachnospiraceae bacterium]|nr:Ig-like domain-containing protein [Lachnospiraceae bacterium]